MAAIATSSHISIVYHALLAASQIFLENQRVCKLRQTGNLGGEQHLVFECPALQRDRDRYNGRSADHAAAMRMVLFMWQHDTRAVAQFIKECMDTHGDPGPQSHVSDQP